MQAQQVVGHFAAAFGRTPSAVWSAPGRVNIIGEHTDYNGGAVLPFAIGLRTYAAAATTTTGVVRVRSRERPDALVELPLDGLDAMEPGWSSYVAGAVAVLHRQGVPVSGIDVLVASDVPEGAGLSSSAALECAVIAAVADVLCLALEPDQIAAAAREVETSVVGVPCGPMDQQVSVHGRAGHALLLDCVSLDRTQLPVDGDQAGVSFVVVDTRVRHTLADGAYAEQRRRCEAAASALGVESLASLPVAGLEARIGDLPSPLRGAARHVATEQHRVQRAATLLGSGEVLAVGPLLTQSHASLRDDLQVSCVELDTAVDAAVAAGALGARLTGAGFGGSVLALVERARHDMVTAAVAAAFAAAGFAPPTFIGVQACDGLRRESVGARP